MENSKEKILNIKLQKTTARLSEKVNITLEIATEYGFVNSVEILINQQKSTNQREVKMTYVKTENSINYFTTDLDFNNIGLYYFCIKIIINNELKYIKLDKKLGKPIITENDFPYWTITVYSDDFEVPAWAKGKIMYHIFVDRFNKSKKYNPKQMPNRTINNWGDTPTWQINAEDKYPNNDFFMGNLQGIEEKIDYLKELGVEIIYLSPICKSQSNHRYDVSDYEEVDPYLGTNEDLKNLCNTAHKNNMKIIIDAVVNHTGNDSKYFNNYKNYNTIGAYEGEKSPFYNWYKKSINGEFQYWWGFKNLPVCDGTNSGWQQYIYGKNGVIDKWFELGIDGLRLDVADELSDEFIENIKITVKRNKKDGFVIGEVWENAITKEKDGIQRKYMLGNGLDSVMNYPFTDAILKYVRFGNFENLRNTLNEILEQYPEESIYSLMNSLSTHDITRAISTLVADGISNNNDLIWNIPYNREWQFHNNKLNKKQIEHGKKLLKIATTIQYFLPGNACIYYGDEIGMYGYKDPFNRACFTWDKIDKELHEFFVELGKIKNSCEFLCDAKFEIIELDENKFIFERIGAEKSLLVAVNRTNKICKLNIPEKYRNGKIIYKLNSNLEEIYDNGIIIILE